MNWIPIIIIVAYCGLAVLHLLLVRISNMMPVDCWNFWELLFLLLSPITLLYTIGALMYEQYVQRAQRVSTMTEVANQLSGCVGQYKAESKYKIAEGDWIVVITLLRYMMNTTDDDFIISKLDDLLEGLIENEVLYEKKGVYRVDVEVATEYIRSKHLEG